jgi:hypothetical protein
VDWKTIRYAEIGILRVAKIIYRQLNTRQYFLILSPVDNGTRLVMVRIMTGLAQRYCREIGGGWRFPNEDEISAICCGKTDK